jgi:hypothetical protein
MSALRWVLGFFEVHAPQSMTRAIAFLCALAACVIAWRDPSQWQAIGALIGGGAVALLKRTKGTPTSGTTGGDQ